MQLLWRDFTEVLNHQQARTLKFATPTPEPLAQSSITRSFGPSAADEPKIGFVIYVLLSIVGTSATIITVCIVDVIAVGNSTRLFVPPAKGNRNNPAVADQGNAGLAVPATMPLFPAPLTSGIVSRSVVAEYVVKVDPAFICAPQSSSLLVPLPV